MNQEPADFYMVWTKAGHAPRHTHDDFESALAEAGRLARENPGKKFIVLKAVVKVSAPVKPETGTGEL